MSVDKARAVHGRLIHRLRQAAAAGQRPDWADRAAHMVLVVVREQQAVEAFDAHSVQTGRHGRFRGLVARVYHHGVLALPQQDAVPGPHVEESDLQLPAPFGESGCLAEKQHCGQN